VTNSASALRITALQLINGTTVITWNSTPGRTYKIQCQTNSQNSVWDDLPPAVTANGSTASATNAVPLDGSQQRFYRVILLP
jgi:hypothetical protein